ncbi:MAG: hypothetical protein ACOC1U_07155, partial [Spirochaetota bacterium]
GDLPAASVMYPYSLSSRDGNLLVASGSFVLETDAMFREQAKIGLGNGLTGAWAMHVGATQAGTIATASLSQGGLARLVPQIPTPYRLPTRNPVMSFAVGDDGAIYTLDMQQNFMRFATGGAAPLDLGLPDGTFISFMATGPENTLLVWEPTQRSILIYDPKGVRVGMTVPHVSFDVALGMKHFQAYPNGDILAVFADRIMRFSTDGRPVWVVHESELPELGGLGSFTEVHLDATTGSLYLLNIQQKRIVQLVDPGFDYRDDRMARAVDSLLALNARLRANPYDQRALAERARLYEEIEAWEAATYAWETAYGIDPSNRTVAASRDAAVVRRLEENAERLARQALTLLDEYGASTAAYPYQRAQEAFERLIAEAPEPNEARAALDALRRRFEEATEPDRAPPPLRVEDVAIDDLFPSLFTRYQERAAGRVTIRNTATREIRDLQVTAEMRFLDFPTRGGRIATLAGGAAAELEVRLPISSRTLSLQESTPVPVNVTVSYRHDEREYSSSEVVIVTVHRATALTWDDSAKLAAYVTPRDGIVEQFVSPFLSVGRAGAYAISEQLFRAARISDAVAASGLEYIEDPQSGITEVLGNPSVIDTVRFPRTTMRVGYGDCDDTTALLASLFESVGIASAIMTSPGHVFLAFDTGEPEQNRWLFESERTAAFSHRGTVWLPYETTILDQGFLASWEEGSRLYTRYSQTDEIEFIPLSTTRERFPPLPLEAASFSITPPPVTLVEPRYEQSLADLRGRLYRDNVATLETRLDSSRGRTRVRVLNQIGILHGQFGERGLARERFEEAVETDADYAASYINLANLSILSDRPADALDWLDRAEELRPDSVITTLLRAQAEYMSGDHAAAAEQMTLLAERAPDIAARYPHLSGGGTGRASEAQATPSLPWSW